MSRDEKKDEIKELLYEIYRQEGAVACLEAKRDRMVRHLEAWLTTLRGGTDWRVQESEGKLFGSHSLTEPEELVEVAGLADLWKDLAKAQEVLAEMRERLGRIN